MNTKKIAALSFLSAVFLISAVLIAHEYRPEKSAEPPRAEKSSTHIPQDLAAAQTQRIAENYGRLPLHFEPNRGQTDAAVKFLARGHGYALFLTGREAVLSLQKNAKNKEADARAVVKMRFDGANEAPKSAGLDRTESRSNYFIGSDPAGWQTEVPNFQKVKFEQIYKGVDVVYYGNNQQLEYDFIVAPHADPRQIKLKFDGVKSAKIEKSSGDLLLETEAGTVRQRKPFVYQQRGGEKREIASVYALEKSEDKSFDVSFKLAEYDRSKELIIDPILAYGSYLGGNLFDEARSVAVDADGNAYLVGTAASRDFPTTAGAVKPALLPATSGNQYWYDAFVAKINPAGTALVFSTYFGGRNGNETGAGVAVDAAGNVVFSGTTMASDLPLVNAYQTVFGGTDDAFAAKINSTGSAIIFSTYLGGNNTDTGGRIALDRATGDAVFTGTAMSPNFPTTAGAYKPRLCDTPQSCSGIFYSGSYLVKLSANGSAVYSSLFDAGINDVTLDAAKNAVIAGTARDGFPTTPGAYQTASSGGTEGFIAKMNPAGTALVYGTFLGGGLQSDRINSVRLDAAENIYVTGQTENTGFPTTEGAFDRTFNGQEDAFAAKLDAAGSTLVYSTFLGGAGRDKGFAVGVDAGGEVFVAGETNSSATGFPLKNSLLQTGSIFVARINADASALVFSTLLGNGGAYDLAVDAQGSVYVTGHTTSVVTTPNAFQTIKGDPTSNSTKDAFVVKLAPTDENTTFYSISGTVDDRATYSQDQAPVIVTVTGTVNRSMTLPYSGNGIKPYSFGNLPAGGNYTVSVRKMGYATAPETVSFPNLGANQFADFTILDNEKPVGVITTPAHQQMFPVPASITIQAAASDPDGHAITKVDFVAYSSAAGSVPLGTDTTAPYEFTWENVPLGTWALYAYPTDELGLRGDSTPTVHIFVVDPTGANVSFTSPTEGQTFTEGGYVPIAVSVSSSVNLVEVTDQNNNMVARMTGSPWSSQWRVMETGTHTLTARAFTQTGQTMTTAPVSITVNPINHRIAGRIVDNITGQGVGGIDVNLTSPTNPNVTAQVATDSSGNYLFTSLGTTPNDSVTITPSPIGYTFSPASKNIPYLGYIEWNNQNFTATAQTQITVAMTSPANGQIFTAPATVSLASDASSTAGAITKVEFFRRLNNGAASFLAADTNAPYEHQVNGLEAGGYTYFTRATDSTGAVAESAARQITVNQPTVTLSGRIANPDGSGAPGVTVYIGGGMAWSEETDANGNFTFANYPGGRNYYITPLPENGITYTPVSRSFTNVTTDVSNIDFLASTPNQPPTVQLNSPADGAVYTMPQPVPINAAASDPDNNIQSLRVTANDGTMLLTIVQTSNSSVNTTWQPPRPGTYELTAIVRDHGGLQASRQITITVNPPAPVSISGRIVDRGSHGIEGVSVELKQYPGGETVVGTATTDASGNYTLSGIPTFVNYVLKASKQDYAFSPRERLYFNLAANQTNADYTGTLQIQPGDFDGDSRSDIAVWRPSTGVWHVTHSTDSSYSGTAFGGAEFGDSAVPGNYDGDKKTDYAVYRGGNWYILESAANAVRAVNFGLATDKPVPGDYDGDGRTDIAVWRPSNGVWYIQRSSDGAFDFRAFGMNGDVPLAGDFDGDGMTDTAVFRPSAGDWYLSQSSDGAFRSVHFGTDGDAPQIGDFDADKKADFVVFRPSNGVWYQLLSADGVFKAFQWGMSGDLPVPGDYDRDGRTDTAVFRPSDGNWYIFRSSTGSFIVQNFGMNGDVPIPAAYAR